MFVGVLGLTVSDSVAVGSLFADEFRAELLRGPVPGGGDLSLGETGQCKPISLAFGCDLGALGNLDDCSLAGCGNEGVVDVEIARCMAAAEGMLGICACCDRDGLTSVEFFLDLIVLGLLVVAALILRGEESRDDQGETTAEGDREATRD